jgi:hypothetical protein
MEDEREGQMEQERCERYVAKKIGAKEMNEHTERANSTESERREKDYKS